MKYLLILTLLTAQAYANTEKPDEPTPQTMEQHQTAISEGSTATANGGTSEATGGSATGGSVGSITTSLNYERPYRNTPNVYAPPVHPTVSCFKGASLSVGALGNALALGAGKIDKGCVRRELIRLAPESHKLYLFCHEPTVLAMFDNHDTCLKHTGNGPGVNKEVINVPAPAGYDDTSLREELEVALSDVREELRQSVDKARAQQRQITTVTARADPYAQIKSELSKVVMVK